MPSPLVLHVASHHINVGDGALVQGIRTTLDRVAGEPQRYESLDVVELDHPAELARFDALRWDKYDLVMVGGGGTIDGSPRRTRSGMAFPMSAATLSKLPAPVGFVAIGYNLFPGQELACRDQLSDVVRVCADRGFPFSVRNDGSLERIQEALGPVADHVVETPDPGFFVAADPGYTPPQFRPGRRHVLLQLAGDNLERRLGKSRGRGFPWRRRRPEKQVAKECVELVKWFVEEMDVDVVLAPHITRDLAITCEVVNRLPNRIARWHTRVLGVPHPDRASQFFSAYAQSDLVVGMRGHSVICAIGLGKPCVGLSTHAKVGGFMEKCGLDDWIVDGLEDPSGPLRERCRKLLEDPRDYQRQREAGTADFTPRFESFMRRVRDVSTTTPIAKSA